MCSLSLEITNVLNLIAPETQLLLDVVDTTVVSDMTIIWEPVNKTVKMAFHAALISVV